jgi:VWFA-related protein
MLVFRAACLATTILLASGDLVPAQEFGETLEVDVVTIDVEARDAAGNVVTDLVRSDFHILEDGRRVDLTNFARVLPDGAAPPAPELQRKPPEGAAGVTPVPSSPATAAGRRTIVYFDAMHLRAASRQRALQQLREWATDLGTEDRVLVASEGLAGMTVELPFSADPAAVRAALDRVALQAVYGEGDDRDRATVVRTVVAIQRDNIALGSPCAPNIVDPVRGYAAATSGQVRRTLDRLAGLVSSLAGLPGRKALVYVSDGLPLQPGADLFEVLHQMCGGGAATTGVGYSSQPKPTTSPRGVIEKPNEGGEGVPMLDAGMIGPGAYQAQSAALDAAGYDLTPELQRLAAHASANRVSFYTLQASGLVGTFSADAANGPGEGLLRAGPVALLAAENLKEPLVFLAHETGGRAILDTNDFRRELKRMDEGLGSYYSLGYAPSHHGDGRDHHVEVRVGRPGVRLTYRRSYRDKRGIEQAADRLVTALIHGAEENPLEVQAEVGAPKPLPNGNYLVTTRLLVPLFRLATITREDVYEATFRVMVIAGVPGGEGSALRQMMVPLRVPHTEALTAFGQRFAYDVGLELSPGPHDVAFAIRDELGGVTSYLRRRVDLPPTAAPIPAATPVR